MITLNVNGQSRQVDVEPDTPLLYVLRNDLALNGAKFGCGLGQCGSCTVLLDGNPVVLLRDPDLRAGEPAASPRSKGSARRRRPARCSAPS